MRAKEVVSAVASGVVMGASIVENFRLVNFQTSKTFVAQNFRRSGSIPQMPYNPEQRRQALQSFIDANNLQPKAWAREAKLSESALWPFLRGKKTKALGDDTYEALADAATDLLGRRVSSGELRGEPPAHVEIPVAHYVGAGDEVHIIDGDGSFDYIEAPPGFAKGAAAIVRGDSMRPTFDPGDMLFFRRREPPPPMKELPLRPVIVQIKNGPLMVKKLLPGTKRGRFHLISVNPLTPPLQDQPVESIARIGWIKPSEG